MSQGLHFDLTIAAGALSVVAAAAIGPEVVAVVGPNGAGKTTLLLGLLGVRTPARGRIAVGGEVLFDGAAGVDVPVEARRLGYVPQEYALFPHMTAASNVEFALAREAIPKRERRERALALLDAVGGAALAGRMPATLSGGERQRVALARALATAPRALLLDEPLAALDVTARASVRASLRERLRALALPALVVTHDPDDARALADRVLVLEAGQVAQVGSFAALAAAPASDYVARFTAGRPLP